MVVHVPAADPAPVGQVLSVVLPSGQERRNTRLPQVPRGQSVRLRRLPPRRRDQVHQRRPDPTPWPPDRGEAARSGVGHIRVRLHRPLPEGAKLGQVSIKREGAGRRARWFVILPVEVPDQVLPVTGSRVGIDLGIAHFLTTSDGDHVSNPRHLKKAEERLAAAQQSLSRKKRGSTRRKAAVARVARLHGTVRRQRLDHAHKTALSLVQNHDVIAHEALVVKNMVRRAKPVPDPETPGQWLPNGGSAKTGLNKSIHDAAWSQFVSILTAKAACAGRITIGVNPTDTSRTCSACEHVAAENRVTQAAFACVQCGHTAHADVNAAKNILRAGLALHPAAHAA